jgi:histidinol-phosphate/aromatic aminotransferase/cobyric acid decarboxylase-like protein
MSELKANFDRLVCNYPSGMRVNSLLAGKYFGIKQDYVCVGNGAAELIKGLMESLEGKLGVVLPTFEEYPNRLSKDRLVCFETAEHDFAYTADMLMEYFEDKDINTLLVVNPDNPSGNFIPRADVLRLCAWSRKKGIKLIIDESFVDFSEGTPNNTLLTNEVLESYPHLVVVKSISKSYGVPGLRLGIMASGDEQFISWLKKDVAIWNINSLGEFYMQIFGKYEKNYQQACVQFMNERRRFMNELSAVPFLRVLPSQANYFLCEVLPPYTSRQLTETLLEKHDILIKDCSGKNAMKGRNFIRIAVRDEKDNNALTEAMKNI